MHGKAVNNHGSYDHGRNFIDNADDDHTTTNNNNNQHYCMGHSYDNNHQQHCIDTVDDHTTNIQQCYNYYSHTYFVSHSYDKYPGYHRKSPCSHCLRRLVDFVRL